MNPLRFKISLILLIDIHNPPPIIPLPTQIIWHITHYTYVQCSTEYCVQILVNPLERFSLYFLLRWELDRVSGPAQYDPTAVKMPLPLRELQSPQIQRPAQTTLYTLHSTYHGPLQVKILQ